MIPLFRGEENAVYEQGSIVPQINHFNYTDLILNSRAQKTERNIMNNNEYREGCLQQARQFSPK